MFESDVRNRFAPMLSEDGSGGEAPPPEEGEEVSGDEGEDKPVRKDKGKVYTPEEVDAIISARFAKWQKKQDEKIAEAERLAKMNEDERATAERERLEKEVAEYRHKEAVANMMTEARTMLKEKNLAVSDQLLAVIVSDDAESTKAAVEAFAEMFEAQVAEQVKIALKGEAPKGGKPPVKLTKAEILAIKDPAERKRAIAENISLFE